MSEDRNIANGCGCLLMLIAFALIGSCTALDRIADHFDAQSEQGSR